MFDFKKVEEKLKEIYKEVCEKDSIYTKKEAIELFKKYDFIDEIPEIIRINRIDDLEFDEPNNDSIYYSENIIEELNEYDDSQEFLIDLPETISDYILANKFKNNIFLNTFTNEELVYVLEILMNGINKYYNHSEITITNDIKNEIKKFSGIYSLTDFISKYAKDIEFCKFILDIYTVMFFEDEIKKKNNKVVTINDITREIFVKIYNKNLGMGCSHNVSVAIILNSLNIPLDIQHFNILYSEETNRYNIEAIWDPTYFKVLMITDYLKSCGEKYKYFEEMNYFDTEYTNFISNNDRKTILKRFDNNKEFSFNIVNEFIELNLFCDNEFDPDTKYIKQIRKINPLYSLDYLKKDK